MGTPTQTNMSKRIFTDEQVKQLRSNSNVSACSSKSITYSEEFKLKALIQYKEGLTSREIFTLAGFDLDVVGKEIPKECLYRWRRRTGKRSGRPKTRGVTKEDKIKRLEAQVAYLKAENSFLAHLRARRAE